MRVAIRGRGTPDSLSSVLQQFAGRLERAGVDGIVGVNLYLRPLVGDAELKLFSENHEELEILELEFSSSEDGSSAPEVVSDSIRSRELFDGRLLTPADHGCCLIFLGASERIGIPRALLRQFLENMDKRREPPRVYRRLLGFSYAAIGRSSSMA